MPSSSVPLCRNGHPILADAVACRTCGAPLTTAPAAPRAINNHVPTARTPGPAGHATTNREVLATLRTVLVALILMALGLIIVMVHGLG